jgi:hypothetical protein
MPDKSSRGRKRPRSPELQEDENGDTTEGIEGRETKRKKGSLPVLVDVDSRSHDL